MRKTRILFSAIVTYILYKVADATIAMRIYRHIKEEGLDNYRHGESAYDKQRM